MNNSINEVLKKFNKRMALKLHPDKKNFDLPGGKFSFERFMQIYNQSLDNPKLFAAVSDKEKENIKKDGALGNYKLRFIFDQIVFDAQNQKNKFLQLVNPVARSGDDYFYASEEVFLSEADNSDIYDDFALKIVKSIIENKVSLDDFKSHDCCEDTVCRLVEYLDDLNNQVPGDQSVFKLDYDYKDMAELELDLINSEIVGIHMVKQSEELSQLTFEIGPDGKLVEKKKTQDKNDKEGKKIDHKEVNTQALVVYSPPLFKLNNSSFKPKKTESQKRFLSKIEDFYGIYWKNKKLFDEFVAGIKETEDFENKGDLADKILELCSEDKKKPDPILLMRDLGKARTNLYDEINKFRRKWIDNYNKVLDLNKDLYIKFWAKQEEKNKEVIDKFDKLGDDELREATPGSECIKIFRDRELVNEYRGILNLINSEIEKSYFEPSSKFFCDFLDDNKTDAAIKSIENKYKEFDNLKSVYKEARTKLENYMDEQIKDLITIDNRLIDSLRFKMLNEIEEVVKDKLGFKDLIKDGAENSEVIKELKQKIKAKVDDLKKKQEENKKETDSFISNLAHDLASGAADKKNEQQRKESLIDFVSTDECFKDHYELTEIVFEQLYGEKSLDELSKIYDEADKENFAAKYKKLAEIYEKNFVQLRDFTFGELKEALDLDLFETGKRNLEDFVFGDGYSFSFDDNIYHKVDKKFIGPNGKNLREKWLTSESYSEKENAEKACLFIDNARGLIFNFDKVKQNVENKVATAKKNFEKYRQVYEKYRNELFNKYHKKYALYKNIAGFNDFIEQILRDILDPGNYFKVEIRDYRETEEQEEWRFRMKLSEILEDECYFLEMTKIYLNLRDDLFKRRFGMTIDEFDKKYECELSFRDALFQRESYKMHGIEMELEKEFFDKYNLNATDIIKLLYISINRQLNVYENYKNAYEERKNACKKREEIEDDLSISDCPWYINILLPLFPVYFMIFCYISFGISDIKHERDSIKSKTESDIERLNYEYQNNAYLRESIKRELLEKRDLKLKNFDSERKKRGKLIEAVMKRKNKKLEKIKLPEPIDLKKATKENFIYDDRGDSRSYDSIKSMFMESNDWKNLDGSKDETLKKYIDRANKVLDYIVNNEPQGQEEFRTNNIIPKRKNPDQKDLEEDKNEPLR